MQRPILVSFNESIPERPVRYTPREQEILDEARERAYQTNAKASIERCHKRVVCVWRTEADRKNPRYAGIVELCIHQNVKP